jgi:putative membrane protein
MQGRHLEHAMALARWFVLLALPAALASMDAAAQPAGTPSRGDIAFLQDAARADLAEIKGSRLAVDKAVNTQVRGYAQQMVDDHTKAHEALAALAANKGVTLPAEPTLAQKARLDLLASADGSAFDRRYADTLGVDAHRDTVRMFQKAATVATDSDIKAWAAKMLPTLQHHLQMATDLKTVTAKEGNAKALQDKKQ